jgi:hypothetical protein
LTVDADDCGHRVATDSVVVDGDDDVVGCVVAIVGVGTSYLPAVVAITCGQTMMVVGLVVLMLVI